jgi:hypothetical protein
METIPNFEPGSSRRQDPVESGEDVKEPPLPETVGLEEKFPRKGGIEGGVEEGASVD